MMNSFHYVYILQSLPHPQQIYTGITADLKNRLTEHNSGRVPHTSKFTPWEISASPGACSPHGIAPKGYRILTGLTGWTG